MKFKKGAKRSTIAKSKQKARAKTKKRVIKKNTKTQKRISDKKRVERKEKQRAQRLNHESQKITNKQKQAIVEKANQVRESRNLELMGLYAMFKIVNKRDIEKTDRFKPEDIKKLCKKFLTVYEKMDEAKKKEFSPLIPLAEKKILQVDEYLKVEKQREKEEVKAEKAKKLVENAKK